MEEPVSIVGIWITVLAVVSILVSLVHTRRGSPVLAMVNRWLRWILFAVAVAFIFREAEWSSRPFWALSLMAFIGWFLFETGYNWLVIHALSRSEMPLFPKFRRNEQRDEWPAQPRYIKVRDWLRTRGFRRVTSLKAELMESIELRSSVYESDDRRIRLQVLFIPQRNTNLSACYVLSSRTANGGRLITDNIFIPFGGFYPEGWDLFRRPLVRSLSRLLDLHRKRMRKSADPVEPWEEDEDALDELNDQQRILEKTNLDRGFLYPRYLQEEHGKITQAGRYRIWKEIWFMNYFGIPVSYR